MSLSSLYDDKNTCEKNIKNLKKIKAILNNTESNLNDVSTYADDANIAFLRGGFMVNDKNPFEQDLNTIINEVEELKKWKNDLINYVISEISSEEKKLAHVIRQINELRSSQ